MSGQITRKVGEQLFLEAQIPDYTINPNVRVFFRLTDGMGVELKALTEILSVGQGSYQEDIELMPNEPVVFAKFYVYDATGTVLQTQYGVGQDRYMREVVVASGGVVVIAEPVEMEIEDTSISGEVVDDSMLMELEDASNLTIEIEEDTLIGEIEDE